MRIANAAFWVAMWIALAVHYQAFSNPWRLTGEAIIPAILAFVVDQVIRRRQSKQNSN